MLGIPVTSTAVCTARQMMRRLGIEAVALPQAPTSAAARASAEATPAFRFPRGMRPQRRARPSWRQHPCSPERYPAAGRLR